MPELVKRIPKHKKGDTIEIPEDIYIEVVGALPEIVSITEDTQDTENQESDTQDTENQESDNLVEPKIDEEEKPVKPDINKYLTNPEDFVSVFQEYQKSLSEWNRQNEEIIAEWNRENGKRKFQKDGFSHDTILKFFKDNGDVGTVVLSRTEDGKLSFYYGGKIKAQTIPEGVTSKKNRAAFPKYIMGEHKWMSVGATPRVFLDAIGKQFPKLSETAIKHIVAIGSVHPNKKEVFEWMEQYKTSEYKEWILKHAA